MLRHVESGCLVGEMDCAIGCVCRGDPNVGAEHEFDTIQRERDDDDTDADSRDERISRSTGEDLIEG